MKYIVSLLFFTGLVASGQLSAAKNINIVKCEGNLAFIKSMVSAGVIKDSTYLKTLDLLSSSKTGPLSQKRRALNVNQDALASRMAAIAKYVKDGADGACMLNSAQLIRDLSEYADFAQNTREGEGLNKFAKNWKAKVYILDELATQTPPTDLPPQLPASRPGAPTPSGRPQERVSPIPPADLPPELPAEQ